MKSYTDLNQSKKLAEILPLESADMYYSSIPVREWKDKKDTSKGTQVVFKDQIFALENLPNSQIGEGDTYAWSLAALLDVMPKNEDICCSISFGYYNDKGEYIEKWLSAFEKEGETTDDFILETIDADNPVDACYEMILKLHELKML